MDYNLEARNLYQKLSDQETGTTNQLNNSMSLAAHGGANTLSKQEAIGQFKHCIQDINQDLQKKVQKVYYAKIQKKLKLEEEAYERSRQMDCSWFANFKKR